MIAVDTSSLVAFLAGGSGSDVESLDQALELNQVILPPVVLTEILSAQGLDEKVARLLRRLPVLEVQPVVTPFRRAGAPHSASAADESIAEERVD